MNKRPDRKPKAWRLFILNSLLISAFYCLASSQETAPVPQNPHQWGSISVFNGLPSDGVHSIVQTPDGFLWFGTENGIARYDGTRIQNFSLGDGDADHVLILKVDPNGSLWAGTLVGAFRFSESGFELLTGTQGVGITSMLFDGDTMLLGSDAGAVFKVSTGEKGQPLAQQLSDLLDGPDKKPLKVTGIISASGRMFVGTYGGGLFTIDNDRLVEFKTDPRAMFINSLTADPSGNIWIGTDAGKGISGIYRMHGGTALEHVNAPTAAVLSLLADDGCVWVGSARVGLFRVAGSDITTFTFENTSTGLRSNKIYSIFVDRENVVWLGTDRGVSRYDTLGPVQQTVSDIPNSNFIRTFYRSGDGRETLAGSNRGMFRLKHGEWNAVHSFENKPIYTIAVGDDGIIAGTPVGIFDEAGKWTVTGDTRSIEMFQGNLYAAVLGRGVINISDKSQPVISPAQDVSSLYVSSGRLWIGTSENGLLSFDGQNVKTESDPNQLKSGTIWNMFEAADHSLWIAGQHGVFVLREGAVEQAFAAEDVRDVYITDGQVWAATTTRGLLHARNDETFGWIVSHVGFEQGFPSDKAFAILPQSDSLMIATNRGVVDYRPANIPPKLVPIRVLSQRFHDLTELRSPIALDYPQNSILVEVAGLSSRTFAEEFQYGFQLLDSKGKVLESRFSSVSQYAPAKLAPGDYTIVSRAFDRDLLASEPLAIRFSIAKAPFPWTATALGSLLALSLAGLIWAIIEHRRIKQRNRELAAARLDLANEAERERRRIARDLHDQTLADLRNLLMMSDNLSVDEPDFRTEIENVSGEIRRICEDLSPSVLENVGFTAALEFLLSRSIDNHNFVAGDDLDEAIKFPIGVQLQIYRIAQEVLTNIRRHSDADTVEMTVKIKDDGRFVLSILDNGKRFEPAGTSNNGRGIGNIKARASLINAKVLWKEARRGGNQFSLTIDD
jgi:signal transduction histidine kinase/ligand-binding sensor domain-containing protein